ncbi:MAG: mechanosensitive ion channel domain-containing protein [Sphingomonadaceae bacterium]
MQPDILLADAIAPGDLLNGELSPALRSVVGWFANRPEEALTLLAIAGGIFLALLVVRWLVRSLVLRAVSSPIWREQLANTVQRTGSWFLALAALRIVAGTAGPPPIISGIIVFLFTVAAVIQAALWVQSLLMGVLQARSERTDDDTALALMRGLLSAAVWIIAFLTLLANLGVNITGLIAGLGIGGIAIGLAAQGVLSDLFAAFSIVFDKPFKRGDAIMYEPGAVGIVEEIGIKSTRIRALSGEMVIMSNAKLLNATVANYATFERRRVVLQFGVTYETSPEQLEAIPGMLQAIIGEVPLARFDRCHLIGYGAYSLDFELIFFVDAPGLVEMFDARQTIMIALMRRFRDEGISFAYPVQVEMLAGPDGKVVDPFPEKQAVRLIAGKKGLRQASAGGDAQRD